MKIDNKSFDLTQVASILKSTFCNAGIFDDYDELLGDIDDDNDMVSYHKQVLEGVKFINLFEEQAISHPYDLQQWHQIFLKECDHRVCQHLMFDV